MTEKQEQMIRIAESHGYNANPILNGVYVTSTEWNYEKDGFIDYSTFSRDTKELYESIGY